MTWVLCKVLTLLRIRNGTWEQWDEGNVTGQSSAIKLKLHLHSLCQSFTVREFSLGTLVYLNLYTICLPFFLHIIHPLLPLPPLSSRFVAIIFMPIGTVRVSSSWFNPCAPTNIYNSTCQPKFTSVLSFVLIARIEEATTLHLIRQRGGFLIIRNAWIDITWHARWKWTPIRCLTPLSTWHRAMKYASLSRSSWQKADVRTSPKLQHYDLGSFSACHRSSSHQHGTTLCICVNLGLQHCMVSKYGARSAFYEKVLPIAGKVKKLLIFRSTCLTSSTMRYMFSVSGTKITSHRILLSAPWRVADEVELGTGRFISESLIPTSPRHVETIIWTGEKAHDLTIARVSNLSRSNTLQLTSNYFPKEPRLPLLDAIDCTPMDLDSSLLIGAVAE